MWAPLLAAVLLKHPYVSIVLSTSWAREHGFSRARDYLPESLQHRVVGATWHSQMARDTEGLHLVNPTGGTALPDTSKLSVGSVELA